MSVALDELFAWTEQDGSLELVGKRVTQCALSRICGVCGLALGRPIAFLGTESEIGRNAFHAPPLHATCAEALAGSASADPGWRVVTTAAFEFVRPAKQDLDRRPTFAPHALL